MVIAGLYIGMPNRPLLPSEQLCHGIYETDFIRPFHLDQNGDGILRLARIMTFTLGCLGTAIAVLFARSDIKSLWVYVLTILA